LTTTDTILDSFPDTVDISTIIDPDVQEFEGAYQLPLIYKYYPVDRRDFFKRSQIRFSPRSALDDPFEMTERWRDISTEGLKNYVRSRVEPGLPRVFADAPLLARKAKEHLAEKGIFVDAQQERQLQQWFESDEGRQYVSNQLPQAQAQTEVALQYIFSNIEAQFQTFVDGFVADTGVLSLTEDPLNEMMWAKYASGGAGFVVGLDAHHKFFLGKDASASKNLLRKVMYTDERTQNF
jgi:hypothetical protein